VLGVRAAVAGDQRAERHQAERRDGRDVRAHGQRGLPPRRVGQQTLRGRLMIRRGRGRGKPGGATVSDGRERRFANHLPSLRDATSSVVEPDRARVSRVGTSANRFLGAHEDFGFGGVRRIAADAREGRARDAPATLRSRWRCPPSEGSCALPSAACSGLGTPPAFRASDSNATRSGVTTRCGYKRQIIHFV
jgi:hypothetical protein